MNQIDEILEKVRENEEIANKFNQVQTSILSILNFKDFFKVLLEEIRDKFNVPYAWILKGMNMATRS